MIRSLKLALVALLFAAPLHAQSLREAFLRLYTFGECGQPLCLDVDADSRHGDHYNPGFVSAGADLLGFVQNAIGQAVGNVPFTAAASGVTYSFQGGAPVATAVSAGPIFADRAETLGRGRFLVGLNVTGMTFSEFRGESLDDLLLRFTHQNVGDPALGSPAFERDYIEVATNLDLSLLVTTVYGTIGLTDRIDVGVAVPLVRSSLSGTSRAAFQYYQQPSPHYFGGAASQQPTATASAEQSAFGLGDVAARIKIFLASGEGFGLGLLGDVRLPTGDEDDFLGAGETTARIQALASARMGTFSPHINGGVFLTGAESQNNRLLTTVGFDQLLGEQITFAADLVGSFQLGANQLGLPDPVVFTAPDAQPSVLPLTAIPDEADHFIDASIGAKVAAGNDFRIVANVLIPINSGGVRPGVLWTAGLEKTF